MSDFHSKPPEFHEGDLQVSAEALNRIRDGGLRTITGGEGIQVKRIGDKVILEAEPPYAQQYTVARTFVVIEEYDDILLCVQADTLLTQLPYDDELGNNLNILANMKESTSTLTFVAKPHWLQRGVYDGRTVFLDGHDVKFTYEDVNRRLVDPFVNPTPTPPDIPLPYRQPRQIQMITPRYYPGAVITAYQYQTGLYCDLGDGADFQVGWMDVNTSGRNWLSVTSSQVLKLVDPDAQYPGGMFDGIWQIKDNTAANLSADPRLGFGDQVPVWIIDLHGRTRMEIPVTGLFLIGSYCGIEVSGPFRISFIDNNLGNPLTSGSVWGKCVSPNLVAWDSISYWYAGTLVTHSNKKWYATVASVNEEPGVSGVWREIPDAVNQGTYSKTTTYAAGAIVRERRLVFATDVQEMPDIVFYIYQMLADPAPAALNGLRWMYRAVGSDWAPESGRWSAYSDSGILSPAIPYANPGNGGLNPANCYLTEINDVRVSTGKHVIGKYSGVANFGDGLMPTYVFEDCCGCDPWPDIMCVSGYGCLFVGPNPNGNIDFVMRGAIVRNNPNSMIWTGSFGGFTIGVNPDLVVFTSSLTVSCINGSYTVTGGGEIGFMTSLQRMGGINKYAFNFISLSGGTTIGQGFLGVGPCPDSGSGSGAAGTPSVTQSSADFCNDETTLIIAGFDFDNPVVALTDSASNPVANTVASWTSTSITVTILSSPIITGELDAVVTNEFGTGNGSGTPTQVANVISCSGTQTFTSDGTFTAPVTGNYRIQMWGNGGSGAQFVANGGGGGGGAYAELTAQSLTAGDTIAFTGNNGLVPVASASYLGSDICVVDYGRSATGAYELGGAPGGDSGLCTGNIRHNGGNGGFSGTGLGGGGGGEAGGSGNGTPAAANGGNGGSVNGGTGGGGNTDGGDGGNGAPAAGGDGLPGSAPGGGGGGGVGLGTGNGGSGNGWKAVVSW